MKKSEVLKEGFLKGLKAALNIISRQLNEGWRDELIDKIAQWFSELKRSGAHLWIEGIFCSGNRAGSGRFKDEIRGLSYDKDSDVLIVTLRDGEKIYVNEFMFAWEDAQLYYGKSDGVHMEMVKGYINQRSVTFDYLSIVPQK